MRIERWQYPKEKGLHVLTYDLTNANLLLNGIDTLFREIHLTYYSNSDTLCYNDTSTKKPGTVKAYTLNQQKLTILKQPWCHFCKSIPNQALFILEDYGIILSKTKFSTEDFERPSDDTLILKLKSIIKTDSTFFNVDFK